MPLQSTDKRAEKFARAMVRAYDDTEYKEDAVQQAMRATRATDPVTEAALGLAWEAINAWVDAHD